MAERGNADALVAYGTRNGSTAGVAERIAARLRARGVRAELRSVADVEGVAAHDAVVLGSPCYGRSWRPEVDRFVRDNLGELAGRPAWLFSVAAFGDRHLLIGRLATREPKNIGDLRDTIDPRDYRVFARRDRATPVAARRTVVLRGARRALRREPRLGRDRSLGGRNRSRAAGGRERARARRSG